MVQGRAGATSGADEAEEILVYREGHEVHRRTTGVGSTAILQGLGFGDHWRQGTTTLDFEYSVSRPQRWLVRRDGC